MLPGSWPPGRAGLHCERHRTVRRREPRLSAESRVIRRRADRRPESRDGSPDEDGRGRESDLPSDRVHGAQASLRHLQQRASGDLFYRRRVSPSGGGPGICGGRRCIGGTEDGQPCAVCIGGANHGATCQSPSACPGGTCSNPRICEGGSNDGASAAATRSAQAACVGNVRAGARVIVRVRRPNPNSCQDDTATIGLDGCIDVGHNEASARSDRPISSARSRPSVHCTIDDDCAPRSPAPRVCSGSIVRLEAS